MKLTKEQQLAVDTVFGNVLCIASAGSGKTSAFTERIEHMDSVGIPLSNVMAVSFTKKASEEMGKRLRTLVGKTKASQITMGTFHSIALRILKAVDPSFESVKICPDWWRSNIMHELAKDYHEEKNPNGLGLSIKGGELASFISFQKSNMVTLEDELCMNMETSHFSEDSKLKLKQAYIKYEDSKKRTGQIDFDDILFTLYGYLKKSEKLRSKLRKKFQYIMIDEFQDTSHIMIEIVKLINQDNVFVVGDFRQSIYSFINADVNNLLDFQTMFNDVKLIELNKNFRSKDEIVDFSNQVIECSENEKFKMFEPSVSARGNGANVLLKCYSQEDFQYEQIADQIEAMINDGVDSKEIAVLFRTNAQTAMLEYELYNRDIEYDVSKSRSFFDRTEVIDLLSYARLGIDYKDDNSFRRVYNSPNRYLSKKFLSNIEEHASKNDTPLLHSVTYSGLTNWATRTGAQKIKEVVGYIEELTHKDMNAGEFMRKVISRTSYLQHVQDNPNFTRSMIREKESAINRLCNMASKFPSIKVFLSNIGNMERNMKKKKKADGVVISTIHSSKGLEWNSVFVPSCNLGLIPSDMNLNEEEERRLFYVACSRPEDNLFLSWYAMDEEGVKAVESPFIVDVLGAETVADINRNAFGTSDYYRYEMKSKVLI